MIASGQSKAFDNVVCQAFTEPGCAEPAGTSPFPYLEIADQELAATVATFALANPPSVGSAIPGTVTLYLGGASQCAAQGITDACLIGNGTSFTTQDFAVNDQIVVEWNAPTYPANTLGAGRLVTGVTQIVSNTALGIADYQFPPVITNSYPLSGLTVALAPANTSNYNNAWWGLNGGAGSNSWNYYGVCDALYRDWVATGLNKYLDWAREYADYWWEYAVDHGSGLNADYSRAQDLQCQIMRILDAGPITANTSPLSSGAAMVRLNGGSVANNTIAAINDTGGIFSRILRNRPGLRGDKSLPPDRQLHVHDRLRPAREWLHAPVRRL